MIGSVSNDCAGICILGMGLAAAMYPNKVTFKTSWTMKILRTGEAHDDQHRARDNDPEPSTTTRTGPTEIPLDCATDGEHEEPSRCTNVLADEDRQELQPMGWSGRRTLDNDRENEEMGDVETAQGN